MATNVSLRTLRPNLTRVEIGDATFFFSYETCVGFHTPQEGRVVSENVWSVTTGKHLNEFSHKVERIPHAEFQKQLAAVMARVSFQPTPITLSELFR